MSVYGDPGQAFQVERAVSTRVRYRSIFTRKLERKLQEKGMDMPVRILSLLDIPFDEFGEEERQVYEAQLKPLAFVLAEHLQEVYEEMGCPRAGWEDALGRLKDSPIKVIAALVLHEEERSRAMPEEDLPDEPPPEAPRKVKVKVTIPRQTKRERWWEKKIF